MKHNNHNQPQNNVPAKQDSADKHNGKQDIKTRLEELDVEVALEKKKEQPKPDFDPQLKKPQERPKHYEDKPYLAKLQRELTRGWQASSRLFYVVIAIAIIGAIALFTNPGQHFAGFPRLRLPQLTNSSASPSFNNNWNTEAFADDLILSAIYRALPHQLEEASPQAVADYFQKQLENDQTFQGTKNNIKGVLFEVWLVNLENIDGDTWLAELHPETNYPGSDVVLRNIRTQESIPVSLKATNRPRLVEDALTNYPDIRIVVTDEVSRYFVGNDMVSNVGITNAQLDQRLDTFIGELLERY